MGCIQLGATQHKCFFRLNTDELFLAASASYKF